MHELPHNKFTEGCFLSVKLCPGELGTPLSANLECLWRDQVKLWMAFPATELKHTKTLLWKGQGCAAQADLQFSVLSALHVAGTKGTRWAPEMLMILTLTMKHLHFWSLGT